MTKIDTSKLKKKIPTKKNRFGEPPIIAEAGENLEAPERAPKEEKQKPKKKARYKTGRTSQFSTRVTSDFLKDFKRQAFEDDLKIVELLEASFEAYKKIKR
ncbi:MAG: hypothetical protein L3J59_13490 [Methylococcaceae bacterium]|nr:hypothetical protein [Methylococcaceae bacterium]